MRECGDRSTLTGRFRRAPLFAPRQNVDQGDIGLPNAYASETSSTRHSEMSCLTVL
jgi:hypothetical protein